MGVLAVPNDPERDGLFADLPTGDVSASAPREGSDFTNYVLLHAAPEISIHAPREGSDGKYRHGYAN